MNGKGIYFSADGSRYEGEWKEGKGHGRGIYYWLNKDWMEGEFKNDISHGKAIYHYADGRVEERVYEEGEIVKSQMK